MFSHILDAYPHKVASVVLSDKVVILIHIDKKCDNVKGRYIVVDFPNGSSDRFFVFGGVESGRNEPAVERHFNELGKCLSETLNVEKSA